MCCNESMVFDVTPQGWESDHEVDKEMIAGPLACCDEADVPAEIGRGDRVVLVDSVDMPDTQRIDASAPDE
jgi:hypothetical protein